MKKRILSIILTLALCLGLLPTAALAAQETPSAADDLTVTIDTGSSVTLKDSDKDGYYEIGTVDELYAFAKAVNDGNTAIKGELTANIVVNTNVLVDGELNTDTTGFRAWTPIGTSRNGYTGTFNGNGKTVSGLYFNDSGASAINVGLFGYVGTGGKVHSVGVVASYLRGKSYVGGVVGTNNGTVENCYNTGAVTGGGDSVGGVVGWNNKGTVTNCYNTGTVTGTGSGSANGFGGVVGTNNGAVTNCYNTGTVTGKGNNVGGVVGWNKAGTMTNCYNTGAVSSTNGGSVGGVAGTNGGTDTNTGTVTNCYNTGTVTAMYRSCGGVVGNNNDGSTVTNCYYQAGCAKDGSDVVQYGIGAIRKGGTTADVPGSTTCKTGEQFASGEVAYLLNGNQKTITFYQTCGTGLPAFSGKTVYCRYLSCGDIQPTYTNDTGSAQQPAHNFGTDGQCTVCGAFEIVIANDITGGTITAHVTSAKEGEAVILTVTPAEGYVLDRLEVIKKGDSTTKVPTTLRDDGTYTFTMPADAVMITANFGRGITISEMDNGTVTANTAVANGGDTVTLTVTPDTGYELGTLTVVRGSDNQNVELMRGENNTYTFTMPDYAVTVTATFKMTEYAINLPAPAPANGTVAAAAEGRSPNTACMGDTVTLTVTHDEGYALGTLTVVKGSNNQNVELTRGENNTYTFTMPNDGVLVNAAFVVPSYSIEWVQEESTTNWSDTYGSIGEGGKIAVKNTGNMPVVLELSVGDGAEIGGINIDATALTSGTVAPGETHTFTLKPENKTPDAGSYEEGWTVTAYVPGAEDAPAVTDTISNTLTYEVKKAVLTVRAFDLLYEVGYQVPNLDYEYVITGFVNGDDMWDDTWDEDVLSGTPVLSYESAPDITTDGTYAIYVDTSGMSAKNYEFNGIDGRLVVTSHIHYDTKRYVDTVYEQYDAIGAICGDENCTEYGKERLVFYFLPQPDIVYTEGEYYPVGIYAEDQTFIELDDVVYTSGGKTLSEYPIDAGTYTASVTYDMATASVEYTIAPRPLTITVDNKSVYVGDSAPEYTYTVTGWEEGHDEDSRHQITGVTVECIPDLNKAGTYEITLSGTPVVKDSDGNDVTSNYNITTKNGTLTVSTRPIYIPPTTTTTTTENEDGSTTTTETNNVTGNVTETTKNTDGSTTVVETKRDGTVTITPIPTMGYVVGEITVTDRNGNEVEVIDNGDGTYTCIQPAGKVTVTVTYVCSGTHNCPSLAYSDLNTSLWYHSATDYVLSNGLMNGVGNGKFDPNGTTTRAMIVTILWRLEGQPVVNYLMQFEDVPSDTWYTEAVRWAASEGIVEGYSDTAFGPNDAITREQFATILWRYAKYKGYDVSVGEDTNILSYEDAFSISEYAIPAMQWACGAGLMEGDGVNLTPKADATRTQAAALFQRFCENVAEK